MTYLELATYLGTANILLKDAETKDESGMITEIRKALCEAQMYFSKKRIDEITEELK